MSDPEKTTAVTTDNVRVRVFDADEVPTLDAARDAEPIAEMTEHNTTRPGYHEAVVAALGGAPADIEADALALGDDDSGSVADGAVLGNETYRTPITDTVVDGQSYTATVFLDSTEANGSSFFEAALVAERESGDLPINRVVIDDPEGRLSPKTNDATATIKIEITQQDA